LDAEYKSLVNYEYTRKATVKHEATEQRRVESARLLSVYSLGRVRAFDISSITPARNFIKAECLPNLYAI